MERLALAGNEKVSNRRIPFQYHQRVQLIYSFPRRIPMTKPSFAEARAQAGAWAREDRRPKMWITSVKLLLTDPRDSLLK
jgi:hypothetical protein